MLQIRAVISPAGWCSPHSVSPVTASVCLHNNGKKMDEFVSHIVKVVINRHSDVPASVCAREL